MGKKADAIKERHKRILNIVQAMNKLTESLIEATNNGKDVVIENQSEVEDVRIAGCHEFTERLNVKTKFVITVK